MHEPHPSLALYAIELAHKRLKPFDLYFFFSVHAFKQVGVGYLNPPKKNPHPSTRYVIYIIHHNKKIKVVVDVETEPKH